MDFFPFYEDDQMVNNPACSILSPPLAFNQPSMGANQHISKLNKSHPRKGKRRASARSSTGSTSPSVRVKSGRVVGHQACQRCRNDKINCNGSPERACDSCVTKTCACLWGVDERTKKAKVAELQTKADNHTNTARELFSLLNLLRSDKTGGMASRIHNRQFTHPIADLKVMGYEFDSYALKDVVFPDLLILPENCERMKLIEVRELLLKLDQLAVELFAFIWTLIRRQDADLRGVNVSQATGWAMSELATSHTMALKYAKLACHRSGITQAHLDQSARELSEFYKLKNSDTIPDWSPRVLPVSTIQAHVAPVIEASPLEQPGAVLEFDQPNSGHMDLPAAELTSLAMPFEPEESPFAYNQSGNAEDFLWLLQRPENPQHPFFKPQPSIDYAAEAPLLVQEPMGNQLSHIDPMLLTNLCGYTPMAGAAPNSFPRYANDGRTETLSQVEMQSLFGDEPMPDFAYL